MLVVFAHDGRNKVKQQLNSKQGDVCMDKNTLRNKSIGTRVSDEEYAALEKLAEARGLTLSEWVREVLLEELIAHPAEQVIVAEVLGLREMRLTTR
jgi:hypothetical protein